VKKCKSVDSKAYLIPNMKHRAAGIAVITAIIMGRSAAHCHTN
jgi:hypothetical protein